MVHVFNMYPTRVAMVHGIIVRLCHQTIKWFILPRRRHNKAHFRMLAPKRHADHHATNTANMSGVSNIARHGRWHSHLFVILCRIRAHNWACENCFEQAGGINSHAPLGVRARKALILIPPGNKSSEGINSHTTWE